MHRRLVPSVAGLALVAWSGSTRAADDLTILQVNTDRPTLHALGVQMLISDDDDRDATVAVRYRRTGESTWTDALPLLRVWPETVALSVPEQFAGSIFDLEPDTEYEIELHAVDPDGLDQTELVTARTRPVPSDPANPNVVNVSTVSQLQSALANAQPGDVITLADGTYAGNFFALNASGTAQDPIVVRGASQTGAILDGQDCGGCNILEVYGSYVHIEDLTLQNAQRALRFQGADATGNVMRRLTIRNVVHGMGSQTGQTDFYICDNDIEGRLVWPWTFQPDATDHWDDRGIDVNGEGHVVCHNRLSGFGDPIVNKTSQYRSWDVYGNDIYDAFDGTELDEGAGNARLVHNRFTNVMAPVSLQPIRGGPAYVLRNVVMNAPLEPIKAHSLGGSDEPSGVLIYHNTFVSPNLALNMQTPITNHNFVIENNLFVGPSTLAGAMAVEWNSNVNGVTFDYNGYYPDGRFWFGTEGGQNRLWNSWAEVQAAGQVEQHGLLLARPIFAADFVGPADEQQQQSPPDFTLAVASSAIDAGLPLPSINSGALGAGPDLGAWEVGCPIPAYGPRPASEEHLTNPVDCNESSTPPGTGGGGHGAGGWAAGGSHAGGTGGGGAAAAESGDDSGCGCRVAALARIPRASLFGLLFAGWLALRRRRRRAAAASRGEEVCDEA